MDDGQEGFDCAAVKRKWLRDHKTSIESMVISRGKAANCSDYTEVVYTNILSKTTGQTVYQVSMVGKGQDHRFVVTSPTNHGNKVSALMSDPDAMVADGWWRNRICTFAQFIQGKDDNGNLFNPYGASVTARRFADQGVRGRHRSGSGRAGSSFRGRQDRRSLDLPRFRGVLSVWDQAI